MLKVKDLHRIFLLAVPAKIYRNFLTDELAQLSICEYNVKLLVFDPDREVIVEWKN